MRRRAAVLAALISTFAVSANGFINPQTSICRRRIAEAPPPSSQTTRQRRSFSTSVPTSVSGAGNASDDDDDDGGTATIPNEVFNLVKTIIGAGVLSVPAGIAAFGNAPSALIPATVLIAVMGGISAYTFSMIARVCKMTGASSYADAWNKTRGEATAWIVALSSTMVCFACNLTYSMVLADTFTDLLAAFGIVTTRSKSLLALTSVILLPLCLIKNLSSLAPFSLVGIMGMVYTSIAIGIRYFGGAYSTIPAGRFLQDLSPAMHPSFGSVGAMGALSPKALILVSVLSTAYIAHFNAPKFYRELKNNTMKRFNTVVASSFGISVVFYAAVSAMGFLTFGSATAGMILSNYSTRDSLISLSRFAVGLSLVFSYALLFQGARDGLLDLVQVPQDKRSPRLLNQVTVVLMAVITALALKVTDVTLVSSLSGALLGTSLIFIFPTLMFRAAVKSKPTPGQKLESRLCTVICALGAAIAGVGAKMSLQ